MNFKKQELFSKNFIILDIGSYKLRSAYCKLTAKDVEILGFGEKRQEQESFFLGEIQDVASISENIIQAVKKSKRGNVDEYVINLPTNQFFLYSHSLNHVREKPNQEIDETELYSIIKLAEKSALTLCLGDILEKSSYTKADLKRVLSSISTLSLDGKNIHTPLGKTGKNIKISLVNIFAPLSEFEIITKVLRGVGIIEPQFIPFEYSILKLFPEEKDVVVVNIGNTKTYISIQKGCHILGTSRISIGMSDLIKNIKKKYGFTQIEILKKIDEYFEEEKQEFLEVFQDCIITGLQDILKNEICPSDFLIIGGGGNNNFIQQFFLSMNFGGTQIKITKNIQLLPFPENDVKNSAFLCTPQNIDILSMALCYEYFQSKKDSFLTKFLEKAVTELEAE